MRLGRVATAFAAGLALSAFADGPDTLPARVVILSPAAMHENSGQPVSMYWRPSPRLVNEADAALLPYLRSQVSNARYGSVREGAAEIISGWRGYRRQYHGMIEDGRRMLYVNGFCGQDHPAWRTRHVTVYDGGPCYFGAGYDPVLRRGQDFGVNGSA